MGNHEVPPNFWHFSYRDVLMNPHILASKTALPNFDINNEFFVGMKQYIFLSIEVISQTHVTFISLSEFIIFYMFRTIYIYIYIYIHTYIQSAWERLATG
jgi:hypothetical protein